MDRKGQVSSVDILVAILLFLTAFFVLRGIWLNNLTVSAEKIDYMEQNYSAQQAAMVLLQTEGYPSNWNKDNVSIAGIAAKPYVIDSEKLTEFCQIPHASAINALGLGKFDFYFSFDSDTLDVSCGSAAPANVSVVRINRQVVYEGGEALVELSVFK
jgi:hypothetical protein